MGIRAEAIVLGQRNSCRTGNKIGFETLPADKESLEGFDLYLGHGHLMTIGPTGAGKGVGLLIPNLLLNSSSMIVLDPKGEACAVTAARRRELGHKVIILDPFSSTGLDSDSLDPIDLLRQVEGDQDMDAVMLAALFGEGHGSSSDPYWSDTSRSLNSGLIAHCASTSEGEDVGGLLKLRDLLFRADFENQLATLLVSNRVVSALARREFAAFLAIPGDRTRPCVLSAARQSMHFLTSDAISTAVSHTSFNIEKFLSDERSTLYIVFPPERIRAFGSLLRIWTEVLLIFLMRRKFAPSNPTLFMVDEASQLGALPALKLAATFMRGMGALQLWTFWQDLSQIKANYPMDFETILNNTSVLTAFGGTLPLAARELAPIFGVDQGVFAGLGREKIIIIDAESGTKQVDRLNYLNDDRMAKYASRNPRMDPKRVDRRHQYPVKP